MRIQYALVLLFLGCVAHQLNAEELNLDFKLINSTGYGIKEIYVGPSSQDHWGENIIKEALKDGEKLEIKFHPEAAAVKWDIKIVWVDPGQPVFWTDLKLTEINSIQIFYDEKTGKTTAKAE